MSYGKSMGNGGAISATGTGSASITFSNCPTYL